jgi:hypothetical protein
VTLQRGLLRGSSCMVIQVSSAKRTASAKRARSPHHDWRLLPGRRRFQHRIGRKPRVVAFPWWLLTLASPFVATFREMREMRYLWREPVDNARLVAALGQEPHTNLDEAVEATLVGLGCLAASATSEARALA